MTRALALVALLLACGCDSTGGDADPGDDGKADLPGGNGSILPTSNVNATLLSGYNTLLDKTAALCVERDDSSNAAPLSIGDAKESLELVYVGTREELARQLEFDMGLKVRYQIVNADASFGLMRQFRTSANSVSLLLKVRQQYAVTNHHPVSLNDSALAQVESDPLGFLTRCGSHYVNSIRYEGQLFVMIRYDARDEQTANEIRADLNVDAANIPGVPLGLEGDMKFKLAKNAQREGVTVNVTVDAEGFLFSGEPASAGLVSDFIGGGITEETFAKIDELRGIMGRSVKKDTCRDAGLPDCEGGPGPGYEANTSRVAKLSGIAVGFYETAQNAPSPSETTSYRTMRDTQKGVERFVRGLTRLQNQMENAYVDDIAPFLEASSGDKIAFNVVPPAPALYTLTELVQTATIWRKKFLPQDGLAVGTEIEKLQDRIEDCWENASIGDFSECTSVDGADVEETEEFIEAAAVLEEYLSTARIRPLTSKMGPFASRGDAVGFCTDIQAGGLSWRLPDQTEVERLAVVIAETDTNVVWYEEDEECGGDFGVFTNVLNPEPGLENFTCTDAVSDRHSSICVPPLGPFGTIPDL